MPSEPFFAKVVRNALFVAGLVVFGGRANAETFTIDFEGLPDAYLFSSGDQNIGGFYTGINFGPDVTGLSVTRFGGYDSSGFPPHSGDVAIWDANDPTITISFSSSLESVGIWYTTFDPLTLQAFDAEDKLLGTVVGDPNTDGTTGTSSYLSFDEEGIQSVTLTSTPGLFVLDDLTITSETNSVPEPNSCPWIAAIAFMAGLCRFFQNRCSRKCLIRLPSTQACQIALMLVVISTPLMADLPVVDDTSTQYTVGSNPYQSCGTCDLNPSYNGYAVRASFNISKITFTWVNNGTGNNCDGNGTYVAAISNNSNASGTLAVSNNNIYLGCRGFTSYPQSGTGELDFTGQVVPANFYLDFYSINGLQDGASIVVSNIEIWEGTTGTIQVLNNLSSGTSASFAISGPQNLSGSGKSSTFSNVTPGEYRIVFGTAPGNFTPQSQVALLKGGGSITFTGNYLPEGVIQQQQDSSQVANAAPSAVGQVFVAASTGIAQSLTVQDTVGYFGTYGTQTPLATAYLYNTNDPASANSSNLIATSNTLTRPTGQFAFTFPSSPRLLGGQTYTWIVTFTSTGCPGCTSVSSTLNGSSYNTVGGLAYALYSSWSQGGSESPANFYFILSGTAVPPPATLGPPSTRNPSGYTNEPINTATGNYYLSHTDLQVRGKGLNFTFIRSYNNQAAYSGPMGYGWTHSYNASLIIGTGTVSVQEADGSVETFSPLGGGQFTPVTTGCFDGLVQNADGSFALTRKTQVQWNFSVNGKLNRIVDRNGNVQTLNYDVNSNLISIIDTAGRSFLFENDSTGRITNITDPIGRSTQYTYDANGNLISVVDAAGGATKYTYDANHEMLTAIDPRGVTFLQNTYDGLGRVVTQTNSRGFVTTLAYNSPTTGVTTFTDPLGNATQHIYDGNLRLMGVTDAKGGSLSYAYDFNNDLTSVTNQNGNTLTSSFDQSGNPTSIIDALGNAQAFTYDATNNLLTSTNPKGGITKFVYDANGNLKSIEDAAGNTTSFTYNSAGLLLTKTDARGNITTFSYDSAGDVTSITDPLNHTTSLTYDVVGRLLTTTDPNAHLTTLAYDPLDRIVKRVDPLNNQTQFAYDTVGNLLKITDANGNATAYAYDATNNLTSVTDAFGDVTDYGYDGNNNRISIKNAKANVTAFAYDPLNRLIQTTDPLSFVSSYAYDGVGNTVSTTDANGKTNNFTYDALNQFTKGAYADGSSVTYAYDQNGNRASMVDSRGATVYSYDALNRLLSVTSPNGEVLQYAYDALGNRTSLSYPDGRSVLYQYDPLNRLSQVTDWASKATHYSYDPAGNLAGFAYPNGATSSYTYDAANRLVQLVNQSGSQVLSSFLYGLDKVGNRVQVTSAASGITKYGYDPLYRLASWTVPSGQVTQYAYDAVGNRASLLSSAGMTEYNYDASDRLLSAGSSSYAYDHNGNQITKTTGTSTISYTYDALNRLTAVTGGGINSQYLYDGDGNRVTETVPAGTYQFLNDTAASLPVVINENGPDGNLDYAYGLSLMSETSASFQYFYQPDGLGSATSITDTNGSLKANYTYDPWGKLLNPIDPLGTKNKYKFAGQAFDSTSGLYFLRARHYDPTVGRFLTRDPFTGFSALSQSLNRYEYVVGNPIRFADPSGFSAIEMEVSGRVNNDSTAPVYPLISGILPSVTAGPTQPDVTVPFELPAQRVQDTLTLLLTSPAPDVGLNSVAGALARIPVIGEVPALVIFVGGNTAKLTLGLAATPVGSRAIMKLQKWAAGPLGWGPISF